MTYAPTHVLGIDQAKASGWGIAQVGGKVLEHGLAKDHGARKAAILRALDHTLGVIDDLLIVFEDHSGFRLGYGTNQTEDGRHQAPTRNTAAILGLGAARGRWDELLDEVGHPEMLRISVTPTDWRARIIGGSQGGTDAIKERAKAWATGHVRHAVTDHNEAEGICLAAWGAFDGISVLQAGRRDNRQHARQKRAENKQLGLWGSR